MRSINPWQLSAPPFIQAPSIFIGNSYLKSYDFFWYQINLNYNYLFDIIMMMMLMPIHVGVPWLSFLASLSGSRAHRDTCVPPVTELWKFFGFKHCSLIHFHFHICYCYHRAELFFAWVLSSSSYHSTWTLCTPPHQHNHAHPISVCNTFCCVWQKVHLASCTLLKTPYLDTWNGITHEFIKMSLWKDRKFSSYCFWF